MDKDQFDIDLQAVLKKHDCKNVAICFESSDEYYGIIGAEHGNGEKITFTNIFESVINLGRLWQHAREKTRGMLDRFEKIW